MPRLDRGLSEALPAEDARTASDALIFRPFWSSPSRSRFQILRAEIISAARGRPDAPTVLYSPGSGFFDYAAFDVIACRLADGKLDLAVPRPDVPLVLHYLNSPAVADHPDRERLYSRDLSEYETVPEIMTVQAT